MAPDSTLLVSPPATSPLLPQWVNPAQSSPNCTHSSLMSPPATSPPPPAASPLLPDWVNPAKSGLVGAAAPPAAVPTDPFAPAPAPFAPAPFAPASPGDSFPAEGACAGGAPFSADLPPPPAWVSSDLPAFAAFCQPSSHSMPSTPRAPRVGSALRPPSSSACTPRRPQGRGLAPLGSLSADNTPPAPHRELAPLA